MVIFVGMAGKNFLIVEDFDICGVLNLRNQGFFGGKMVAAMNKKNFLRNMRKIRGGEKSGVTTTDDSNGLILIKGAIASCAIGNAVADELGFIDEIETAWRSACGENDRFSGVGLIASESEMCGGFFKMFNLVVGEGKTEGF